MSSFAKQEKQKLVVVLVSRQAFSRKNRSWSIHNNLDNIYFTGYFHHPKQLHESLFRAGRRREPGQEAGPGQHHRQLQHAARAPDAENPQVPAGSGAPGEITSSVSKELDLPHGFSFAVGTILSQLVWIEFQSQKTLEIRSDRSQDRILRN